MALFAVVERRFRSRTKERSPPVTSFHLSENSIVTSNTTKCPSHSASSSSLETVTSFKTLSLYDNRTCSAPSPKARKSPVPRHPHYTNAIHGSIGGGGRGSNNSSNKRHTRTRRKAKCRECLSFNSSHSSSSSSLATSNSTTSCTSNPFNSLTVTTIPDKCTRQKRHTRRSRRKNIDKIESTIDPNVTQTTRKHKLSISSSGIEMDNSEEHMCKIFLFVLISHFISYLKHKLIKKYTT